MTQLHDNDIGRLAGKVAVITGATSGMALATAKLFVKQGAHVYITGRRKVKLDEAVSAIEATTTGSTAGSVTGVQADSGQVADLDRVFDAVKRQHGRLDVLYASAGTGSLSEPLEAVTEQSFDSVFGVNVRGTLFTVQKAVPLMTQGGSIIINGSAGATKGVPGQSVYLASKAALRAFVRNWTMELSRRGIRVNLISPGPIGDTATFDGIPDAFRQQVTAMVPLGRMGRSDEIASAVLFLATDDASFVQGADLPIDGGLAQV